MWLVLLRFLRRHGDGAGVASVRIRWNINASCGASWRPCPTSPASAILASGSFPSSAPPCPTARTSAGRPQTSCKFPTCDMGEVSEVPRPPPPRETECPSSASKCRIYREICEAKRHAAYTALRLYRRASHADGADAPALLQRSPLRGLRVEPDHPFHLPRQSRLWRS
jgi:hypothetical protein